MNLKRYEKVYLPHKPPHRSISSVQRMTDTLIILCNGERYYRGTGTQRGGDGEICVATPEHIAAYDAAVAAWNNEQERIDEEKRQQAYDALPESVKLARKVKFFCEFAREQSVAELPIEGLRAIVQAIETQWEWDGIDWTQKGTP